MKNTFDLAPRPLARLLVELGERRATGSLSIGSHRLRIVDGNVVRLETNTATRVAEDGEALITELGLAMEEHEQHDLALPVLDPDATPGGSTGTPLVVAVLETLRRTAIQEAGDEAVPTSPEMSLEFSGAPPEALSWLGVIQGKPSERITNLVGANPEQVYSVVAFCRAGLARTVSPSESVPPPPRRRTSLEPTAPSDRPSRPSRLHKAPPTLSTLPPRRSARVVLDPGRAPEEDFAAELLLSMPESRPYSGPLMDPFEDLERSLLAMEQSRASGTERARAWVMLGKQWLERAACVEEAARCLREASAADPQNVQILSDCALQLSSNAEHALALAYARAAERGAQSDDEKSKAQRTIASVYARAGHHEQAVSALASALLTSNELVARALLFEETARVVKREQRAHWLERAGEARLELPTSEDWALELYARALDADPTRKRAQEALRDRAFARIGAARAEALREDALRENASRHERVHAWLTLAAYEAFEGHTEAAIEACRHALELAPNHPEAKERIVRLARRDYATSAASPSLVVETALQDDLLGPKDAADTRAACLRLFDEQPGAESLDLALRVAACTGDLELLQRTLGVATQLASPTLEVRVLERLLCRSRALERSSLRIRIAQRYRALGSKALEARTFLRALGDDLRDRNALERLAEIYEETRESDRLLAIQNLRVEAALDQEEKIQRQIDLASSAALVASDTELASEFWRGVIVNEHATPKQLLQACHGLCAVGEATRAAELLFERASNAKEPAKAADLYEKAVLIAEKLAGDPTLALRIARKGLEHCPSHSPLLVSFERLALAMADVEAAKTTYESLSRLAPGNHTKKAILYRAGRWFERVKDPELALSYYRRALELAPAPGVVLRRIEHLSETFQRPVAYAESSEVVAEHLPLPGTQAQFFMLAAQTYLRAGDYQRAASAAAKAVQATPSEERIDEATRLCQTFSERAPEVAKEGLERIESLRPEKPDLSWAQDLAAEFGAMDEGRRSSLPSDHPHEAAEMLQTTLRRDPSKLESIEALHNVALKINAAALRDVTFDLLSAVDPRFARSDANPVAPGLAVEEPISLVTDEALRNFLSVMRLLWTSAGNVFRKSLKDVGVSGADKVPARVVGLSNAYEHVVRVLRPGETPLYTRPSSGEEIFPAATMPPCVIASRQWMNDDSLALRDQLAQAVLLCQPEFVLLGTMLGSEVEVLVTALYMAFGAAESGSHAVKEVTALAGNLWQSMDARAQRTVQERLRKDATPINARAAKLSVTNSALKAGLLVTGSLHASFGNIMRVDDQIREPVRDRETYLAACRKSELFRELVRFALSDEYLAAYAQAQGLSLGS